MISYEGRNRETVNFLKTIYFDYPEWTPCVVGIMPATWMKYREDLEDVLIEHPKLFPNFERGKKDFDEVENPLYEEGEHVDCWGCTWKNIKRGLDSVIVGHPSEDWDVFDSWTPPDPLKDALLGPRPNWDDVRKGLEEAKREGGLAIGGGLPHGFMYMRLYYLRGFSNLMLDFATDDPQLHKLISIVLNYNVTVIQKFLELGAEYMIFGEDLGFQSSLPISPKMWRKYIKPCYEAMFGPCRDRGIPVYFHTDGHILEIIPDLIETGVRVLNPQIGANSLTGLQEMAKGKVAIDADLNRQLFPFATPTEIEAHIKGVFEELHMKEGGLMLYAECEPDVPLENIHAICSALEEICNLPESGTTPLWRTIPFWG